MARIFISHSSANNAEALALRDWLVTRGWDDLFLDIDPQRGLVSGQRWLDRLQESAQRCKAVLFVLSRAWLASEYCRLEFLEARKQERPLFWLVIDDTEVTEVPAEMRDVWQFTDLTHGSSLELFSVKPPPAYVPTPVQFSHEGLESLRLGLGRAGLTSFDTESFSWPDPNAEHEVDGTPRRPYRGLEPIDFPDAGVFFGRDADLVRAHERLADLRDRGGPSLVVLLGASGSGKSSFLRAGLLPRLARDDRRFLPLPVLRPRSAAMWGAEGLLAVLAVAHRNAGLSVTHAELRNDLESDGTGCLRRLANLSEAAARGLPGDAKPPTLVVPIDQAEELFTTVRGDQHSETGAAEAGLFLARLADILRNGPETIALVTIRSDSYEPLQTAEALACVPQVPFNLPPLAPGNYRSVIEGPADRASDAGRPLSLEPELVEALLAESQDEDALPLLGFTLERLYVEHGGDGELTRADYDALGGVQGSIEAAVAEAFANPDADPHIPADAPAREALLKRAFVPHLMGVNEANGEPVRRTARLSDLPGETRGLVDRLVNRRLLVVDRRALASGTATVIEVAHEALLRLWPTLRRWHDQERATLEIQQEIARASSAWNQNSQGASWLDHRSTRLAEAEAVARREDFANVFNGVPRAYLDACRKSETDARDAEEHRLARQRTMQRRVGVLLSVVALVTLVGGWQVVVERRDLARQTSKFIASKAKEAFETGHYDSAVRLALVASQGTWFTPSSVDAEIQLGRSAYFSRLEAQLTGAGSFASFSPVGAHIVTSGDKIAQVWSRGEDCVWRSVALEGGPFNSASFSSDGARIVTASWDKTARVWNLGRDGTWHSVALQGHQGAVTSASFSLDGARVLTSSLDNTARVWSQGKDGNWHSTALKGHKGLITSASFSPDGARIATASEDKTLRVWSEGEDGTWHSMALEGHQGEVTSAAFSPDGTRIVTASWDKTARVWSQAEDGAWYSVALRGHQGPVTSASFSPDSIHIVTTSQGTARVWNQGGDGAWRSIALEGHQGLITSASFSLDGNFIVTASSDNTARVWNQSEDGVWHSVALQGHQGPVTAASFSPDGALIITVSWDKTSRVWSHVQGGAWNRETLEQSQDAIRSASFSPDGARVITASDDKTARMWSRGKDGVWTRVAALNGHQAAVTSVSFSPNGAFVATASEDGTARVWSQAKSGVWVSSSLEGHRGFVASVSFSPDGARIITASNDKTARVWSRSRGGAWHSVTLEGHKGPVHSASFSPDGARIVTASDDTTARVWSSDRKGFWTSIVLNGNQGPLRSATFSPDGSRIVTASADGTARMWS
ncbi:MAG TPA: TIR domain-containing protein, partial [Thermoanaerobaculia bacterium]